MKRLRFGILVNDLSLQKWQLDALKELKKDDLTDLVIVVKKTEEPLVDSRLMNMFSNSFLFKIYNKLYVKKRSAAFKKADISNLCSEVKILECNVNRVGKYTECFSKSDIDQIKREGLDFMIRFGFGIIRGEILSAAKNGVWSYHHDDERVIRGGPPCFWELYNNLSTTGAILQRLTDKLDGGKIIRRGVFHTHPYSYWRNIDQVYTESSKWISLAAKELLYVGKLNYEPEISIDSPIYKAPSSFKFILFLIRCSGGYFKHLFGKLFLIEIWNVAVGKGKIENIVENQSVLKQKFEWFPKLPYGEFIADQFLYEVDGQVKCILEHYKYGEKGSIRDYNALTPNKDDSSVVFSGEKHFSYPYIFIEKGKLYCTPECYEGNSLNLYELNGDKWEFVRVLIPNKQVVDASILFYNDRYWIFCGLRDQNPNLNLYIFSSNRIDGIYEDHPLNPVKTNVEASRPAGNFILKGGKIFRPAQNSSKTYGGSITLNQIITLNETGFHEEKVTDLLPLHEYSEGLHTLSYSENYVAIDGKKIIMHPLAWLYRLKNKLNSTGL